MSPQKLLYIISQAPYSNSAGQEAIDAILIGASFEQEVSVLFLHDGVFQIKSHQQEKSPQQIKSHQRTDNNYNLKQFTKTYRALSDFGIENIYVLDNSLSARGLAQEELIVKTVLLDNMAVNNLIQQQYRVFTF